MGLSDHPFFRDLLVQHPEITFLTFILAPKLGWTAMLLGASFYGLGSGSYMSCLVSSKGGRLERRVSRKELDVWGKFNHKSG